MTDSTPSMPVLKMRGIGISIPDGTTRRSLLGSVDLSVSAGELVAVMGPSGSGKSTLLGIAAGLVRPDAGTVTVCGEEMQLGNRSSELRWRRSVGLVEQRLNLLALLTAVENVALPLELAGTSYPDSLAAAREALAGVDLADRADVAAGDLSGGEQQRVAVARALIGERRLLVADEPTAALDPVAGEGVMRLLRRRCDSDGAAVLLATHDPSHAAFADRVVRLRAGSLTDSALAPTAAAAGTVL